MDSSTVLVYQMNGQVLPYEHGYPARVSGVAVLARATDGTGELQEQTFALPQPNGGTGWPRIELKPT